MAARIIQLCDAVTAFVNAQTFTIGAFTAERQYQSDITSEEIADLVVRIAPLGGAMERQDTGSWSDRQEIEIGIGKKLVPGNSAAQWRDETDSLIAFVQELYESLRDETMELSQTNEPPLRADVDTVIYDVAYSKEDMVARGEFSARLAIAYEIP